MEKYVILILIIVNIINSAMLLYFFITIYKMYNNIYTNVETAFNVVLKAISNMNKH